MARSAPGVSRLWPFQSENIRSGMAGAGGEPMKWFLILWAGPMALLGSWYGLSYYDINFGLFILTRQMHDLVFQIYGQILGIPPEDLPPMILKAILFDSFFVLSLVAFRKRSKIAAWWQSRHARLSQDEGPESSESLSSAP